MLRSKRIVAVIASVMMVMSLLPAAVSAAETEAPSIKIKGNSGEAIEVQRDASRELEANVKGAACAYHVHWKKTGGKKYANFVVDGAESAEDVVSAQKLAIKGATVGETSICLELVEGSDHSACSGNILAKSGDIKVVVTAETDSYGPQGKNPGGQTVELLQPKDITILYPENDSQELTHFMNKINVPLLSDSVSFRFQMGKEMGSQFNEEAFLKNTVSKIKVYDAQEKQQIAGTDMGNLIFEGYRSTDRSAAVKVKEGALAAGNYVLVFGADIYVNNEANTLGVPVKFQFAVKAVKAQSIALNKKTAVLKQGGKMKLTAAVRPEGADKSVVWKSSNPSVASVDAAGTVKARKGGSAVITAVAKDGSGVKASCSVSVIGTPKAKTAAVKGKVTVKWKKVSGVSRYAVYKAVKKNGTYHKLGTTKKLSFADKKVKKGKTYYYKVKAYKISAGKKIYGNSSSAVKCRAK